MKITLKKIIWIVVIIVIAYVLFDVITNPDDFMRGFNDAINGVYNY